MKQTAVGMQRDSKGRFIKGGNLGHPIYGGQSTQFKKGHSVLPGSEKGWFKEKELHPQWKGENIKKDTLHSRIEKELGKPNKCDFCKTENSSKYEWSNVSGEYKYDHSDWQRLCSKCHQRYDWEKFGAREKFYAKQS